MARRWQRFRLMVVVGPLAGLLVLTVSAIVVSLAGYRPRGDALAGSSFGLMEIIGIYVAGFMPSGLLGIVAAALPRMSAWAESVCLILAGLVIGLSPLGWWLAASLVPPNNNSLVVSLTFLTALLTSLACWHFNNRLKRAGEPIAV